MNDICQNTNSCPCDSECHLMYAFTVIGGKWKAPILCSLSQDGTLRYNELKRRVRGITNTMLAQSLKELEEENLITRHQFMEVPPRVEYTLSPDSQGLIKILDDLADWGISHMRWKNKIKGRK